MLIFEGPDNSGKTTLAQAVAAKYGLEYRRPPALSSTGGVNDHVFKWWEAELEKHPRDTFAVYDRCTYISDPIYRLVSGKYPLRNEAAMQQGVMKLINRFAHVVFCLPRWEWSRHHCEAELAAGGGLKYSNIDQLRVIHWAYHNTATLWQEASIESVYHHNLEERLELVPEGLDQFILDYKTNFLRRASAWTSS